jgi:hypothetical protein
MDERIGWRLQWKLCPAIRARVQTSRPDSPSRVQKVCRRLYRTNARTVDSVRALLCCFFTVEWFSLGVLVAMKSACCISCSLHASHDHHPVQVRDFRSR